MYPRITPIEGNIELVQNSGIQFVDFDALMDWKTQDRKSVIKSIEKGYFIRVGQSKNEPLVRLVPRIESMEMSVSVSSGKSEVAALVSDIKTSDEEGVCFIDPINRRVADIENASLQISLKQSLQLYDGVWFPLPFLPEHGLNNGRFGPFNWVRARVVKVTDRETIASSGPDCLERMIEQGFYSDEKAIQNAKDSFKELKHGLLTDSQDYYRIVIAFDTQTQNFDDNYSYFAPTERDVESGVRFKLAYTANRSHDFLKSIEHGLPWVEEWARSVFTDLYRERIRQRVTNEEIEQFVNVDHEHEAHYLNMLAFVGFMLNPKPVHFIANHHRKSSNSTQKCIDVSLILDIGNSRSCGILVEDHPNVTRGDDDFSDTYVLTLRDLNTPEIVYSEPFSSRIEFAKPNFDYDNRSARSGRPDAFSWPSMVRVGNEATNLASHRVGNEGSTGLTSPKRYLWNTDPLTNDRWMFNNYSYQIKSKKLETLQKEHVQRAFLNSVGRFFNTEGRAYFALDKEDSVYDNLESCYSNRSTMTFMLIEIIQQALVQMNSVAQRQYCTSKDAPRRLSAVILTTPPGMVAEEKELYRACVYEALGILWKSLGLDLSSPREFNFAPSSESDLAKFTAPVTNSQEKSTLLQPIPKVYLDWNEAEAGQVVYIYNESQKVYHGDNKAFLQYLRRPSIATRLAENLVDKDGDELISARIASLDIGGGTTDLVIKDYSFKKNVPNYSSDIIPHEVFRDGLKIAGDDLIHDLIKECILPRLALTLARRKINFRVVLQQLVGDVGSGNVQIEMLHAQFTQQILVQIAYKILFHLEHLDPFATSCVIDGTVRDFLNDEEKNPSLAVTVKRPGPCNEVSESVVEFVNETLGKYLPNFSILDYRLSFDLVRINEAMISGTNFNLCRVLNKLCEVINCYECDLLLLTGRSSRLGAIKSFFMQRLNLPAFRILPMHQYRCDNWYPFKHDGEYIADPKTTASVGALLCYLRLFHDKFPNFRFYSYPEDSRNNAHYVGIIDNTNKISDEAVLYRYESSKLLSRINNTEADEEESNFVPHNRKDEHFNTQLSVELGCRLLDSPNFEAQPLYKIEAHACVDDIKRIRKALILTYQDLSREQVTDLIDKFDFEIQDEYRSRALSLLDNLENLEVNMQYKKDELLQNLQMQAQAEVAALPLEEKKGLFGRRKIERTPEEVQALVAAIVQERYNSNVLDVFNNSVVQERYRLETELSELLNNGIEHNISLLRERYSRGFERLLEKLNAQRSSFEVTLRKVNRNSPYPLPFIRRNLPKLKTVETFELESVISEDGVNYTEYFKMYLKTISGAKVRYFMDSGTIDLSGINPRIIL